MAPLRVEFISTTTNAIVAMLKNYEICWSMPISEPGNAWEMLLAIRQKMYYDRDTAPRHFKKGDWFIYWHKPTAMQTLSSAWIIPFVVTEKVSVVDYGIQLRPEGSSKVVDMDQLFRDSCYQERINWIRDKLAHREDDKVVNVGMNPIRPQQTTVDVSIVCQTSDTDPIIVSNDKVTPMIIVHRSSGRKRKHFCLVYYLQI